MLTPVSTRPRLSVGVLVFPFVCGLVFFATTSLARHAGTEWSPQPSWTTKHASARSCSQWAPSGLGYEMLAHAHRPDHAPAMPDDRVTLRMAGWTHAGESLAIPPGPSQFRLNQLIPGFVEGVALMTIGDRMRFCIPEQLAYKGRPGAPPGMLTFDVALVAIERAPAR